VVTSGTEAQLLRGEGLRTALEEHLGRQRGDPHLTVRLVDRPAPEAQLDRDQQLGRRREHDRGIA